MNAAISSTTTVAGLDILSLLQQAGLPPKGKPGSEWEIARAKRGALQALAHPAISRDEQNQRIADLYASCGSLSTTAGLLGYSTHTIKLRLFAVTETFAALQKLWPGTETTLLMTLREKLRTQPELFQQWILPYLERRVGTTLLRSHFQREWNRALHGGLTPEEAYLQEKEELEVLANLTLDDNAAIRAELQQTRQEQRELKSRVEHLEVALAKKGETQEVSDTVKNYLESLLCGKGKPTLTGTLEYLEAFYADRVLILPSAWKSAKESDRAGFEEVEAVMELTLKLVKEYVDARRDARPFHPASFFGHSGYAQNEGSSLKEKALQDRTFSYLGKSVVMLEHLKVGTGKNKGQTFRAHFAWDSELNKVVIGHFGKHLNR